MPDETNPTLTDARDSDTTTGAGTTTGTGQNTVGGQMTGGPLTGGLGANAVTTANASQGAASVAAPDGEAGSDIDGGSR